VENPPKVQGQLEHLTDQRAPHCHRLWNVTQILNARRICPPWRATSILLKAGQKVYWLTVSRRGETGAKGRSSFGQGLAVQQTLSRADCPRPDRVHTDCAYRKLRLPLSKAASGPCNNVTRLLFVGYLTQKIDLDVVDSVAIRPR